MPTVWIVAVAPEVCPNKVAPTSKSAEVNPAWKVTSSYLITGPSG